MLELKTPKELATESFKLAEGYHLVRYRSTTYLPADYETGDWTVTPDPDRTMWIPQTRELIRRLAAQQFNTLFQNDGQLNGFDFMVAQNCVPHDEECRTLLVKTPEGLRELREDGQLHEPTGEFVANTLVPRLNTDEAAKAEVFGVIAGWLNSEDEARMLLRHFATALAPGWSAVKYVLMLGKGRNGKSVLLKMMQGLFGADNCSNVTRQQMSDSTPSVCDLNGKLLNLVFDGQAEYVKDSGNEKSLIAGEMIPIRRLYDSTNTPVQTNALFVEGLNAEPKSKDKSTALQRRLVRFQFPNEYPLDHTFERKMLAEESLGALLALLIDNYVLQDEVAQRLAPTRKAIELQLEHMYHNSLALQFLKHTEENDPLGAEGLLGVMLTDLVGRFRSWRLKQDDIGSWAEPDVMALFDPLINTARKSKRINNKVQKVRVLAEFKLEARQFIESLKGDENDGDAVVED